VNERQGQGERAARIKMNEPQGQGKKNQKVMMKEQQCFKTQVQHSKTCS
jgi:hypothetical protein